LPEPARGLILLGMRLLPTALLFALPFSLAFALPLSAHAQSRPQIDELPGPEPLFRPQPDSDETETEDSDNLEVESADKDGAGIEGEDVIPEDLEPDYSKLSPKAEREARLNDLFIDLASREDEESANLVAEEITAIWVESGSASVNLLLRRGSDAAGKGDPKMARKMYNHAVDLSPDYAEAWSRSARLALTQKDFNRALNESLKTLTLEPRHFYALWTLGNTLEALNRPDDALEAYREANELYPELKAVKDRLGELEVEVDGSVL